MPQQLDQPTQGSHPPGAERSALAHLLADPAYVKPDRPTIGPAEGLFLERTWRLHPDVCEFTSGAFYAGRLRPVPGLERQQVLAGPLTLFEDHARLAGTGLRYQPVPHLGNDTDSPEESAAVVALVRELLDAGATWVDADGVETAMTLDDIVIVAPYNAHVAAIERAFAAAGLGRPFVGTVDRFQGQERPVSIYAMATSTPGGCAARDGVPVLAQPAQRGHVAGSVRGGRRGITGAGSGRLPHPAPDAARQRPVPGHRGCGARALIGPEDRPGLAHRASPGRVRCDPGQPASSVATQAASTRAQASTSASATCSSAACARRTSPGPKMTHGVSPTSMNSRMSAPYGTPSASGRRPVTASATAASPTGSG